MQDRKRMEIDCKEVAGAEVVVIVLHATIQHV